MLTLHQGPPCTLNPSPPKKVYSMDDVYIFFIKPRKHAEIQKVILVMTLESSSSAKTHGTAFEFMIKVIGFWEQPCWTFSKAMLNFAFLFRVSGVCVTIERVPCILPLQREGCAGKQQGCTSEAETNSSHLTRWHPKRKFSFQTSIFAGVMLVSGRIWFEISPGYRNGKPVMTIK